MGARFSKSRYCVSGREPLHKEGQILPRKASEKQVILKAFCVKAW